MDSSNNSAPAAAAVPQDDPICATPPYELGVIDRALDAFIALMERVMPDMSQLGAVMLIFMLLLALSGNLTADDDVIAAQQAAAEAAAATPNYVPF